MAFPDQNHEIIELRHSADAVIAAFWLTGTHRGPLGPVPPTQGRCRVRTTAYFPFDQEEEPGLRAGPLRPAHHAQATGDRAEPEEPGDLAARAHGTVRGGRPVRRARQASARHLGARRPAPGRRRNPVTPTTRPGTGGHPCGDTTAAAPSGSGVAPPLYGPGAVHTVAARPRESRRTTEPAVYGAPSGAMCRRKFQVLAERDHGWFHGAVRTCAAVDSGGQR
ncbi:hypothetical protein [Streptomyces sp. TRM 70361]|uniref:hypothetical protein n=1 Tax=Streptomyces sp. TRM 70361 TaxID=3116553 RepID=UPI003FCDD6DF